MSRVEAAIQEGRCVLAIGGRALQGQDLVMELRRRSIPSVALGGDPVNPVGALNAENLAPVLNQEGSVLVLVEPEAGTDGRGLDALGALLAGASHKPRLFVAARAFNPFSFPMSMRLLKIEQIKQRARDFVGSLPVGAPAPVAAPVAAAAPAAPAAAEPASDGQRQAPRPVFVGREEELAALGELLGADGGPIIVTGAPGVGRRWLVERALADAKLERLPDFVFGRGVATDGLLSRIAVLTQEVGDDALANALKKPDDRPNPTDLAALAAKSLQNPSLKGKVWVFHELHRVLDRRDGSLHRMGRLELILKEILTSAPALRLVFVSNQAPTFYKEGDAANLRVLPVAGIKGKELHLLFKAWHVDDVARDRFGPIVERTHGHPVLSRFLALAVAEGTDIDELLKAPRFLKASDVEDLDPLKRHLKRRVDALDEAGRAALAAAAHLRLPGTAAELQLLGLSRNDRINLLALGLMEQTPFQEDRRYYVHSLVREHLTFQETSRFDLMETLGDHYVGLSRNKDQPRSQRLSYAAEGHRLLVEARRRREVSLPFPDQDALLESLAGLMRRKQPRLDIARARVNEGLKIDPKNTELYIADAELKGLEKATNEVLIAAWAKAAEVAPTPEVFHQECSLWLDRNARGKAVTALEKGVAAFPTDARMYRRLANLYLRQNRVDDAVGALRLAMEHEPMMPDSYSMMGEIAIERGPAHYEEAQSFIDEAMRLDPNNPSHQQRLAALLRARGLSAPDQETRLAHFNEAIELLKTVVQADPESARAHALLGGLILDVGGDLDQAEWLVKRALKLSETPDPMVQRARVLVRRQAYEEAERLLDKVVKREPSNHAAFAAQGELLFAQGQIFVAFEHYKKARERSGKDAPERALYDTELARLSALIEAGAATDLAKQAEAGGGEEAAAEPGPRRDPGATTMRRRRRGGRSGDETTQETALADGDEATVEAPLAPDEDVTVESEPEAVEAADPPAEAGDEPA